MSHIGKKSIPIPSGVTVMVGATDVVVKGPKGELTFKLSPNIAVQVTGEAVVCALQRSGKQSRALWGTTRARIANMIKGVVSGFTRQLELQGVGYRAALKGKDLEMNLGFSHPVRVAAPQGISFKIEKEIVTVEGIDNQLVGQVASDIRSIRPPEPYKGKGVRYVGEVVRRKVGKVVGTTGT